jgi:hypothetical protein
MIIGALSRVLTTVDINTRQKSEQLDAVSSFIHLRALPEDLGRRIRRHFRHFYSNKAAIDETRIFTELSTSLRKEVSAYLVSELMGPDSFFMTMPTLLWPRLLPLLRPMRYEMRETVCVQGEECTEMYVVLNGLFLGSTEVDGEAKPRVRHIVGGGSINVLRVLGVWSHCVESVVAEQPSDVYELNSKEFHSLFVGHTEAAAFQRMQRREVENFKMNVPDEYAPTKHGRPLYMSCFSTVEMTLVKARDLMAATMSHSFGNLNKVNGTVHGEKWVVAELVSTLTWRPYNNVWFHESARSQPGKATMVEPFWNEEVRWMDIDVPFDESAVRVRLFESDHNVGKTVLLGQVHMNLVDVERKDFLKRRRSSLPPPPVPENSVSSVHGAVAAGAKQETIKLGEVEAWFDLNGDGDLRDDRGHPLALRSWKRRWFQDPKRKRTKEESKEEKPSNTAVYVRIRACRPEKEKAPRMSPDNTRSSIRARTDESDNVRGSIRSSLRTRTSDTTALI